MNFNLYSTNLFIILDIIKPYWIHFTGIGDPDVGFISVAQSKVHVPFTIQRLYWVYDTPDSIERGHHAHISTQQVLIAIEGKIEINLENQEGDNSTFNLESPEMGLYVPPLHWRRLQFSPKAILLSIVSTDFNENDYIRSYDVFKKYRF